MAEELDTSGWFDLKNYEPLKTLSIKEWASVLESRAYIAEVYDCAKQTGENLEWTLQKMAVRLRAGDFAVDEYVESCLEDYAAEIHHSFSTSSVDSLRNYQAWDMANDRWPSRELIAFQKMRDEWHKPCEDDEDGENIAGLIEVAHAPYDFHFKQYLSRDYIPSTANVTIDLNATDGQIENDFSHWLTHYRKASGYRVPKKKSYEMIFNQKTFDYWIKYGLIPYLDLMLIAKIEGKELPPKNKLGDIIFPDERYIVDTGERLEKITEPEAKRLLEEATRSSLLKQATAVARKKQRRDRYGNKKKVKKS